jgi:hypothetical protein
MSLFTLGEERSRRCYSVAGKGRPSRGSYKIRDETASTDFQPSHLFCRVRVKINKTPCLQIVHVSNFQGRSHVTANRKIPPGCGCSTLTTRPAPLSCSPDGNTRVTSILELRGTGASERSKKPPLLTFSVTVVIALAFWPIILTHAGC